MGIHSHSSTRETGIVLGHGEEPSSSGSMPRCLLKHAQVPAQIPANVFPEGSPPGIASKQENVALRNALFPKRPKTAAGQCLADTEFAMRCGNGEVMEIPASSIVPIIHDLTPAACAGLPVFPVVSNAHRKIPGQSSFDRPQLSLSHRICRLSPSWNSPLYQDLDYVSRQMVFDQAAALRV